MTRPSQTDALEAQRTALRETLRVAVPLHIIELRGLPLDMLLGISARCAGIVGEKGDILQFKGGKRGETAEVFNALARGLAAAALVADGGVDFIGLHWCAIPGCRSTARFDHAGGADEHWPPEPSRARPIHDLPDLSTWPPPTA